MIHSFYLFTCIEEQWEWEGLTIEWESFWNCNTQILSEESLEFNDFLPQYSAMEEKEHSPLEVNMFGLWCEVD